VADAPREVTAARLREHLVRAGLFEARTLPLGPEDGPDALPLVNPLSAEERHLRRRLLPGLVRRSEHNWSARTRDIRLFEVGNVFRRGTDAPEEYLAVAAVLSGSRHPPHWSDGGAVPDMDIWDLKHHFEATLALAWPGARVRPAKAGGWEAVGAGGDPVGWAGPLEADRPVWAAPLLGFETRVADGPRPAPRYRPLPTTPPVERDVALVVPEAVAAAEVERVLTDALGPLLERLAVFDQYRGPAVPAGTRSLAWHLTFRAPDRTLREKEVDERLMTALTSLRPLGVRQRES
jgi:phenylalanyl-tRNA synthetase beta chain